MRTEAEHITLQMAGSYSEVQIPAAYQDGRFLELDLQSGGNVEASTEDAVFQDRAGGFLYKHNRQFSRTTRNRSILWKVSQNCIYLTELSQDLHLYGNQLKLKLKDATILPRVDIHESATAILIVIATPQSVHRLSFTHPIRQGVYISSSLDATSASIFNNNPVGVTSDPWCFASLPKKCQSFSSHQSVSEECLISLITIEGSLLFVTLPAFNNQTISQIHELKQTSIMKRLWSGLVPTVIRGDNLPHDSVQSCVIHSVGNQCFIFTLCKDLKIRIWSCKSLECIEEQDLGPLLPDVLDSQSGIAQAHMICKAMDKKSNEHYIGVFLNFRFQSQFFAFEIFEDDGDVELSLLSSRFTKQTSLLDFTITHKYLWALWASASGQTMVQYAAIEEKSGHDFAWHTANLQAGENAAVFIHHSADPREIYLDNLFMPGRFSRNVLLKTIQMTSRSLENEIDLRLSMNSSLEELREGVEKLIQYEMQKFMDHEVEEDEFYNLQMQCWSKFYASAVQYDQVERKPVGLYADETTGLVSIIRQNYRGYLVANDWLEHLYLNDEISHEIRLEYLQNQADVVDADAAHDVLLICDFLKQISMLFADNTMNNIESSVANNEDVNEIFTALVNSLLTDASDSADLVSDFAFQADFVRSVGLRLKDRNHLLAALSKMIDSLDPNRWLPADFEQLDEDAEAFSINSSHSFSSKEGRAVTVEAIFNRARMNFAICRDLSLLINVIMGIGASAGILADSRAVLEAEFLPRLNELLRSYFTIMWLRRNTLISDNSDTVENSLKKFAALELIDTSSSSKRSRREVFANSSLLSSFVSNVGIPHSLKIFGMLPAQGFGGESNNRIWEYDFKLISDMIFRLLWPLRDGTHLPEFLLSQGQATLLCEYLFICTEWCTKNSGSRQFLMGQACLQNGEHDKARTHFFQAAKFIGKDEDLLSRLLPEEITEKPQMIISYFITVMRMFEQFDNPEMVIVVANAAVFLAKNSKAKEVAMLWSNIFKCHMQLGHNKDAYQAIVLNPDKQRRRNCLHNFIVTLCERGQLQEICEFSYSSLENEVVNIIETRARTVDITINDYYDLLYAFHCFRGDMRRAATAMYEFACRLRIEMHGLASLQQQAKCYLASINCLQICDAKYAWIVRPSEKQAIIIDEEDIQTQSRSPKRTEDGEEIILSLRERRKATKKTVIVELADLEKEYLLILARLNLLQFDKNSSAVVGPSLSALEVLPLLAQAGLFDRAFAIAMAFKLDLEPIFEGLAAKCVKVANDVSQGLVSEDAFNWLTANDLGSAQPIKDISAVEQAWRLLQSYLQKFTAIKGPLYHKAVAKKLLSLSCSLPTWLVNDYKERNAAELLQLYVNFDLLEEAGELTIEYINAVLGIGKEYFGLKNALHATTPAVWLPYTAIDQLVQLLKDKFDNPALRQLQKHLDIIMEQYFNTVKTASQDKIEMTYRKRTVYMDTART